MRGSVVCRLVLTPILVSRHQNSTRRDACRPKFRRPADWPPLSPPLSPIARPRGPACHVRPADAAIPDRISPGALASSLTVRHLPLEQGIEGSNPSSPAKLDLDCTPWLARGICLGVGRRAQPAPHGHGGQPAAFNLRQPPARLLATICRNIAVRAGALIGSPSRIATVRAVLLSWPDVMIPSGSGTMPPS